MAWFKRPVLCPPLAPYFTRQYNRFHPRIHDASFIVSEEVQYALEKGQPVVALESALITHGLPFPVNYQTAMSLESIVRSTGCIPATIGLLSGKIMVGMSASEVEILSNIERGGPMAKISRRDIGSAIALKRSGGTTIAGTMVISHAAGIRVFGTGGLGGVHRGGEDTLDISADLTELGRTPVAVVSSGVKAILDIGRTLEYLETEGVPVLTYGPTKDFPAFYSRLSGHRSPWNLDSPAEAARVLRTHEMLGIHTGVLVAVPIPKAHEHVASRIQQAVELAIQESIDNGVSKRGNDVTPWLLRRVAELTKGEAVKSNIALLENNVRIAGKIAAAYAQDFGPAIETRTPLLPTLPPSTTAVRALCPGKPSPASIVVIGAAAVDIIAHLPGNDICTRSTLPGTILTSLGGVARNVAETTHRLLQDPHGPPNEKTLLVSPIGSDHLSTIVEEGLRRTQQRTDGLLKGEGSHDKTAVCSLVLSKGGDLIGGVADMGITEGLSTDEVAKILRQNEPSLVAFDANITSTMMEMILRYCHHARVEAFFEPTSVSKCVRILDSFQGHVGERPILRFMSSNALETQAMYEAARARGLFSGDGWWKTIESMCLGDTYRAEVDALRRLSVKSPKDGESEMLSFLVRDGLLQMATHLLPFVQMMFIKLGHRGALLVGHLNVEDSIAAGWRTLRTEVAQRLVVAHGSQGTTVIKHFPALPILKSRLLNTTGAGDSFSGALLAGLLRKGCPLDLDTIDAIVRVAQRCAILTLSSDEAVAPEISEVGDWRQGEEHTSSSA